MSPRPSGDAAPRPARGAMTPILGWTIAGAAVPAVLLIVPSVLVALASLTTDALSFTNTIGMLVLTLVMIVPPGAVGGFVMGLVDFALRGYVRRGAPVARRRRALLAAGVTLVLSTALGVVLLAPLATKPMDVAFDAGFCGLVASIPAAIAYRLYRRLPVDADAAPRPEGLRAP